MYGVWIGRGSVHYTNIYNNAIYDLRTIVVPSVDATNNYWGTSETAIIDQHIFDYYDDYYLPKVTYEPLFNNFVRGYFDLKLKVNDLFNLPITGASVSMTMPNGTTVTAITDNDGAISFPQAPCGPFSGTASYLFQTVPITGDLTPVSTTSVLVKINFSPPVLLCTILPIVGICIIFVWRFRCKAQKNWSQEPLRAKAIIEKG